MVEQGYDFTLTASDGRVLSSMAFYPLFPWTEKSVAHVLPVSTADAGLLVSAISSILAAVGIFLVTERIWGPRAALYSVILWAALPVGIVQSMAYSESLFTALAVWALYLLGRDRWILAGTLACLAGLTRPVGIAVTAAVWAAATSNILESGRARRAILAAALAPTGAVFYIAWVGIQKGSWRGYLDVQKSWGNGFDCGITFARFVLDLLTGSTFFAGGALCAGVVILAYSYWLGFRGKYPIPLQVYTGIVLILAIGSSGFFGSKPRFLIPAFTILIPAAAHLAKLSVQKASAALAALVVVSASYGALWLNGSGPP
ncbi:glycosyltransferase family 39 protein [Streptomyces sp. NPDC002659]|uniref:glycosyltransferase family 39 protein n=1 Tax=Streptomyces sp. NPDC002659 TaxID=3364656 RepID=UPI0036A0DC10